MSHFSLIIDSPLGKLIAKATDTHLIELRFADIVDVSTHIDQENSILSEVKKQLCEYFLGKRKGFTIPLAPEGTDFQKKAWKALEKIPYGETRSYKEEALLAGNPKAIRAIGGANNKNPIVIIIPCHRVIGADGKLVGYGGGIERKKWLLEHEKQK
ncbi:methylated-DNA--[protein]-cysteine S-methyltransferase [Candidatus Gracilibacteria bacterium]|nr:methylated-DNA--[protein]-cysteine S-methyltransferase [Candidatus Gracilibacteria bacterium]